MEIAQRADVRLEEVQKARAAYNNHKSVDVGSLTESEFTRLVEDIFPAPIRLERVVAPFVRHVQRVVRKLIPQ
ncbi:MAG: hypothetical protein WCV81_05115 [Microgenomates group bacterium]